MIRAEAIFEDNPNRCMLERNFRSSGIDRGSLWLVLIEQLGGSIGRKAVESLTQELIVEKGCEEELPWFSPFRRSLSRLCRDAGIRSLPRSSLLDHCTFEYNPPFEKVDFSGGRLLSAMEVLAGGVKPLEDLYWLEADRVVSIKRTFIEDPFSVDGEERIEEIFALTWKGKFNLESIKDILNVRIGQLRRRYLVVFGKNYTDTRVIPKAG